MSLARSPIALQRLLLRNITNALRLLVADLNRRDLVAVGDAEGIAWKVRQATLR